MAARTLYFENAILDLFEKNRIPVQDAKIVLWTLLTAIYENELIEEPQRRETIIENIERRRSSFLLISWVRDKGRDSLFQRNRRSLRDAPIYVNTYLPIGHLYYF